MRTFAALIALAAPSLAAAVPLELAHQGRLLDATGVPLDGDHTLTIALYDAPSGGDPLWDSEITTTLSDGYFSVVLGRETPLLAEHFDGDALFLGLAVDGQPELSPRQPLATVPFAVRAGEAASVRGGVVDASEIRVGGQIVVDDSGVVTAPSSWSDLTDVPAGLSDGLDDDTLAALSCAGDQVAAFDGAAWTCRDEGDHIHGADALVDGTVAVARLPIGTSADHVAAGNHTHHADALIDGTVAVGRLPVGSGADEVAAGDHTHTAFPGDIAVDGQVVLGETGSACTAENEGAIRYDAGRFSGCTPHGWTVLGGVLGESAANPARTCAEVLANGPTAPDGIYWLDADGRGGLAPIQAYCDMTTDGGGWTLLFKQSAGAASDPHADWTSGDVNLNDPSVLDTEKNGDHANPFATTWWGGFAEARVVVRKGASDAVDLRFDTVGANSASWFSKARLRQSPWTDLQTAPTNYFSIAGDDTNSRHWFVNREYGGCANDAGWLVVHGAASETCPWNGDHTIRYAPGATSVNWMAGNPEDGDVFLVFAR